MAFKTKIAAEIGTSHNGDLKKAFSLIDAAVESGADVVKFQWVYADEILHPATGIVNLPTGKIPLYERFRQLEVDFDFMKKCCDYVHKKNAFFMCSPFGIKSLNELLKLDVDFVKIASPELNHTKLLEECSKIYNQIPIVISSGVSRLSDIEKAIEILKSKNNERKIKNEAPLILLHCETFYPSPEKEYNVKCVKTLRQIFGCSTGISDHSLNPILVPTLSVLMGGSMIEKHITLSKKTDGLDDPVALEPEQFYMMSHAVNQTCTLIEHYKSMENLSSDDEIPSSAINDALHQLYEQFEKSLVDECLGSGIKFLAPSEMQNYGRTNRSLHFMNDLKAGEKIKEGDIGILRTEKELSPGLHPEFFDEVVGSVLQQDASSGEGVEWRHVICKK